MNSVFYYFVEGECEKKLIDILKMPDSNILVPGKVQVFNVMQNLISKQRILAIPKTAHIIFVYDVDVLNVDILKRNVKTLEKYGFKKIFHIHSFKKLEDELVHCTNVNNINSIFDTSSDDEFKRCFLKAQDNGLKSKLIDLNFDSGKLWTRFDRNNLEQFYSNNGIKLIKVK